jgi:hypothetical protein
LITLESQAKGSSAPRSKPLEGAVRLTPQTESPIRPILGNRNEHLTYEGDLGVSFDTIHALS